MNPGLREDPCSGSSVSCAQESARRTNNVLIEKQGDLEALRRINLELQVLLQGPQLAHSLVRGSRSRLSVGSVWQSCKRSMLRRLKKSP